MSGMIIIFICNAKNSKSGIKLLTPKSRAHRLSRPVCLFLVCRNHCSVQFKSRVFQFRRCRLYYRKKITFSVEILTENVIAQESCNICSVQFGPGVTQPPPLPDGPGPLSYRVHPLEPVSGLWLVSVTAPPS